MSYIIHKSDNKTKLAEVPDGSIDQLTTDITLIGKNYSGFGQVLNENFVKLLENFASTEYPSHPVKGQIWYDSVNKKLKVYSGSSFVPVSSTTVSSTQPPSPNIGDLWYNDSEKQLFFWNGNAPVLLGPSYTDLQQLSGLKTISVLDKNNQTRVVSGLYNGGVLLGLFASERIELLNKNAIAGFSGEITVGFNASDLIGLQFNTTSTNAENLGGYPAANYVKTNTANALTGQLRVTTDAGIVVGVAGAANLTVNSGNVIVANGLQSKSLILAVKNAANIQENAIVVTPSSQSTTGIVAVDPEFTVNVGGDLSVNGNLIVKGDTTSINTTSITVKDKVIELATPSSGTPSDSIASGGGLILHGSTDHSIIWSNTDSLSLSSQAWNSTEHFNLSSGKEFKIGGVTVITGNSLGEAITSIPGVTSFGTQEVVNIGPSSIYLKLTGNTISTEQPNADLRLSPNGDGNVALIGNPRITGLAKPEHDLDAANREYVDDAVKSQPLFLSLDFTGSVTDTYIAGILELLVPVEEHNIDTIIRVLCNTISYSSGITISRTIKLFVITTVINSPRWMFVDGSTTIIP
jgi:hypothetical protein